jgi:hypothetical protein
MRVSIKNLPKFSDLHCYGQDSVSRPKESSYRLYFDVPGDTGTIRPYIEIFVYDGESLWNIKEWRMVEVFESEDYLTFVDFRQFNSFLTPIRAYVAFREFFESLLEIEYELEYTDKFGGEANYSWVERKTTKVSPDISDSALIRLAKKEMGLTGRHKTSDFGCDLRIDFPGTVLFITEKD